MLSFLASLVVARLSLLHDTVSMSITLRPSVVADPFTNHDKLLREKSTKHKKLSILCVQCKLIFKIMSLKQSIFNRFLLSAWKAKGFLRKLASQEVCHLFLGQFIFPCIAAFIRPFTLSMFFHLQVYGHPPNRSKKHV